MKCWGHDAFGQVGDFGNQDVKFAPVDVVDLADVVSIDAGFSFACAVLKDGTAKCWGRNAFRQLGSASQNDNEISPVSVTAASDITEISAGGSHACALQDDGKLICWGFGDMGQLGATPPASAGTEVAGLSGIASLSADGNHTCVSLDNGELWCWGSDFDGEIGDGSADQDAKLTPVRITDVSDVATVTLGASHSCAIDADGKVYCWGKGVDGRIGDNSTSEDDRFEPVAVYGF